METQFKASLDNLSKVLTIIMSPIFVLWPLYMFYTISQQPNHTFSGAFVMLMVLVLGIYLLCLCLWVKSYTVDTHFLTVNKFLGQAKIDRANIKDAKYISKNEMGFVIRIMGNGGIFGYTGYFTSKTVGRMRWHVTNKDNMVLITLTNNKVICVSPDDVPGFLKQINK
jgi:Bacterial PH domain